jgi:hypothetical protein
VRVERSISGIITELDMLMELQTVTFGDGARTSRGWFVVSRGAIRGLVLPCKGELLLCFAYDKAIELRGLYPYFRSLEDASEWLERRLEPKWDMTTSAGDAVSAATAHIKRDK